MFGRDAQDLVPLLLNNRPPPTTTTKLSGTTLVNMPFPHHILPQVGIKFILRCLTLLPNGLKLDEL